MTRDTEWAVFEKACEITASAVRGTISGSDGQQASFVGEVFREVHAALKQAAEELMDKNAKAGF
jgi:histone H3/H4